MRWAIPESWQIVPVRWPTEAGVVPRLRGELEPDDGSREHPDDGRGRDAPDREGPERVLLVSARPGDGRTDG